MLAPVAVQPPLAQAWHSALAALLLLPAGRSLPCTCDVSTDGAHHNAGLLMAGAAPPACLIFEPGRA
eukprot:12915261-Prorocentrum_lima.AAC.1